LAFQSQKKRFASAVAHVSQRCPIYRRSWWSYMGRHSAVSFSRHLQLHNFRRNPNFSCTS